MTTWKCQVSIETQSGNTEKQKLAFSLQVCCTFAHWLPNWMDWRDWNDVFIWCWIFLDTRRCDYFILKRNAGSLDKKTHCSMRSTWNNTKHKKQTSQNSIPSGVPEWRSTSSSRLPACCGFRVLMVRLVDQLRRDRTCYSALYIRLSEKMFN